MIRKHRNAWEIRVYVGTDPVTGKRRTISRSMPAKPNEKTPPRRVVDEERRLTIEARDGKHGGSDFTVADLCTQWLTTLDTDSMSPWTVKGYHDKVRLYIVPRLGRVKLSKLTIAMLDRFYAELRKNGNKNGGPLKPLTVHHVHATLHRALNRAVRWGWIDKNPAELAEPPKVVSKPMEPPTLEEVERLIDHAEDPTLRIALMLAVATGARRGELCGLRWIDIDEVQAAVRFARSIANPNGEIVVKQPKTNRTRVVAVGEHLLGELQAHRDRRKLIDMTLGQDFAAEGYILSESEDGLTPLSPGALTQRFTRLAKDVGVTCRLHDLRHGHVTWLLAAGVPVKDVADRVGHSSARMTLDVYGHALPATDRTSADITDNFLRPR